ncbi:serine hydrolase domain-containing protein [Agromyces silvae]|uniref:serine hydrolase domain-containing protein n=1 Tax=Agromyces silvae TaxID=3388266 RepID=UPI00280B7BDE|nr:serine hydrolase domain-containing protein [Agromyces protaetiae]
MTTHDAAVRASRRAGVAVIAVAGLLVSGCATGGSGTPAATRTPDATTTVTRPAAPEGELPAELQEQLQRAVEQVMTEYDVPGAAAGVWIPGEGSWTTAAGLADVEDGVAATTDMVWPIRSITKSYTVTMLLQLADEGALRLDDTIDQYVDGITDGDRITLLQLANMSSGNADYVTQEFFDEWQADPAKIWTLDELNSFVIDQPAQFAPGTEYLYTNANTNLLGAVIEEVTGQSYAEALDERILEPLGQTGTAYLTDVDDWAAPHPVGYFVVDGTPLAQNENPSILAAAGSLFSTLDDGRVWAEILGTGALLKPETQELRQIGHQIPKPPYDRYAVGMGETDGWWGHNGEGIGFTAATFHHPDTGASIVVYMNESDTPDKTHPADTTFRALAEVLANGAAG